MDCKTLKEIVLGPSGLSANFLGKQNNIMTKDFDFKLVNDTTKDVTFALIVGSYGTTGQMGDPTNERALAEMKKFVPEVSCIAAEGDIFLDPENAEKKCTFKSTSKASVEHLQHYFSKTVGLITSVKVNSAEKGNLVAKVQYQSTDPFSVASPAELKLSDHFSVSQQDSSRTIANLKNDQQIPLSPLNYVMFTVMANSEMDISLSIAQVKK